MTEEEVKKLALEEAQKRIPVPVRVLRDRPELPFFHLGFDCRGLAGAPEGQFYVTIQRDGIDLKAKIGIAADEILPHCK